jgi:hypothetical protein
MYTIVATWKKMQSNIFKLFLSVIGKCGWYAVHPDFVKQLRKQLGDDNFPH